MKKIYGAILLFFLCLSPVLADEYLVDEFWGVPVVHDSTYCGKDADACFYSNRTKYKDTIVMSSWYTKGDYMELLTHEYAHYFIIYEMSDEDWRQWRKIHGLPFDEKLRESGIDTTKRHVSEYAKTNVYEDFCETFAMTYWFGVPEKIETKADFKRLYMFYLLKKYSIYES